MASKFSRAALIAGLAVGAGGLVAGPASAANGISTANYYVNNPAVTGVSNITPESVTVSGAVDTGGNPESLLPVSSAGLVWSGLAGITITPENWNDGQAPSALTTASAYAPIDGIPTNQSTSNVSVTITDAAISNGGVSDPGIGATSGKPQPISNAGADNYSDVTFEYDPVSDYDAVDGQPGPNTQFAQDVQVPTAAGISSVTTALGAFGQAAQDSTGNTALTPGTKYYYWIIQQAGATDQASNIDVAAWVGNTSGTPAAPTNNSYKCYPNVAIAADPTLAAYTAPGAQVNYGGTAIAADQGTCIYYYGNTGGQTYYQSGMGTFTTPKLGSVNIQASAKITKTGKGLAAKPTAASLVLANASGFKASGSVKLTAGGKLAGTAKFSIQAHVKATVKIALTAAGKTALTKGQSLKVAPVSQTATIASTSAFDQPFSGKSVKL